jgi:Protein kinase domain
MVVFQGAPTFFVPSFLHRQVLPAYQQLVRSTMRLYKQKDIPKSHRSALDCPPGPPSASPDSPTPHRLKRAAEAVSRQISGHKAMVAQFKDMKLPRPPMFSTKPATATPTDRSHSHSLPPKQSKATKGFGKFQTASERSPTLNTPTSAVSPKRRSVLSNISTNSPSPTRPPGLGLEKATSSVNKPPAAHTSPKSLQSVTSPIRSLRQRAGAEPATSPSKRTSTVANLASVSAASTPDEPILFVSCFHSLEEDPEIEEDPLETVELIFGVGLGHAYGSEVRHDEIAPPKAVQETTPASTLEPMSAVVEWWEPEPSANLATEFDAAVTVKSKGRTDGFEAVSLDQNQIARLPSTHMGSPSLSLSCQPTSALRFDMGLPKTVPRHLPSPSDYEYVASLGQGAFGSVALYVHKRSQRQCAIKIIRVSGAIPEEQRIVRAVLAEQRIMREASDYPFLLGLLASFRDVHSFYLVSVSPLFPRKIDSHRLVSGVLSFYSIR